MGHGTHYMAHGTWHISARHHLTAHPIYYIVSVVATIAAVLSSLTIHIHIHVPIPHEKGDSSCPRRAMAQQHAVVGEPDVAAAAVVAHEEEQVLPHRPVSTVRVVTAAGKATGLWLLLYVAWMHCLVVWKWSSEPVGSSSAAAPPFLLERSGEPVLVVAAAAAAADDNNNDDNILNATTIQLEISAQQQDLVGILAALQRTRVAQAKTEAAVERIAVVHSEMQHISQRLQQAVAASLFADTDATTATNLLPLGHLTDFFMRTAAISVTETDGADLEEWIDAAVEELQPPAPETSAVPYYWPNVTALFRRTDLNVGAAGRDLVQALEQQSCVPDAGGGRDGDTSDFAVWADRAALEAQGQAIEDLLANRRRLDPPVQLTSTLDNIQAAVLEQVAHVNALAAARSTPTTTIDDNIVCIRTSSVVPWVQAGLQAVRSHKDTRPALLHQLALDAVDTTGIILDAALEDPAAAFQRSVPLSARVSLRRWLGTPVVTQLAPTLLDHALELVSGRFDKLDQWLDSLATATTDNTNNSGSSSSSIGRKVVKRLLEQAGKVQVPVPSALRKSKIGSILPRQ